MFTRPMLFLGVLVACVVVPYIAHNEQLADTARGQWQRLTSLAMPTADRDHDKPRVFAAARNTAPAVGPPIEQALRFEITPQWVAGNWPRVSTVVGDHEQLGMRVAWVSGTGLGDVAGSLTYYFDKHHQLQRLTFTGLTADARRTLAAVVGPFGLKSQPTTDAAHYLSGDPQHPTSEVVVRHLPILTSTEPGARAEISLDIGRPDAPQAANPKADRDPEPKLLPATYRRW